MSNNFFIKNVSFFWASVHAGDEKPDFDKTGYEHSVLVVMSDEQKEAAVKADPFLAKKVKKIEDEDQLQHGTWGLRINNPVKQKSGKTAPLIKVVDSSNKPIPPDIKIGNGSKGHLQYGSYKVSAKPGFRVRALMVKELVEYNTGFEAEDDGYKAPAGNAKDALDDIPWDNAGSDEL